MKTLVVLLVLANLAFFAYTRLDSLAAGEAERFAEQVQPDKIRVLTAQQVAALGPAKAAALANVCVEWGPFADADRTRALAALEPLDVARLLTQKRVEVLTSYWVFVPALASRAAADRRAAELRAKGVKDLYVLESGPQRFGISLGVFGTEDAATARLAALTEEGVTDARSGPRTQSSQQTAIVIRDPPAAAVARVRELQPDYPGTDVKTGSCAPA